MDTIHELKRVLEIQLNYMDRGMNSGNEGRTSLSVVRQEINRYKRLLSILLPLVIMLGTFVCIAALATVLGANWIPWQYMGIIVVTVFVALYPTFLVRQRLEEMKKRELFLFMLHKIDRPR